MESRLSLNLISALFMVSLLPEPGKSPRPGPTQVLPNRPGKAYKKRPCRRALQLGRRFAAMKGGTRAVDADSHIKK